MAKDNKSKVKPENGSADVTKYILLAVLIIVAGYFIYTNFFSKEEVTNNHVLIDPKDKIKNIKEPQFRKEGELEFLSSDGKKEIRRIDVELAENDDERTQGLMYRRSMDDEKGMLFIFPNEEPQSFWMRNTVIPLDIMYVNSKKEIVKIFKNTTPFSETSLPSGK
ncbi:MAG: DUF192 domain-containing protein, partial [Bacteroidota bacterium]|nr:DUF192 domain-containing protein [Bacteroidota bacterium]